MTFNKACELIKSSGLWDTFLTWFAEWFVDEMDNEELILEHTAILYADSLSEL